MAVVGMALDHAADQREAYYIPSKGTITQPLNGVVSTLDPSPRRPDSPLGSRCLVYHSATAQRPKNSSSHGWVGKNHYQKIFYGDGILLTIHAQENIAV